MVHFFFYNFHDPLTAILVTSTSTWHRGYGFFEVCQAGGRGFESNLYQIFCAVFFRLCDTFFRSFFYCLQRVPFHFFQFCKRMDVQKLPKAPLLHFSALCDLPETKKNSKKIKNSECFSIFFSRGYCRREYLTH